MNEQGGKLLRLVDHPRFRTTLKDPELVEVAPGEYLTRAELTDLRDAAPDQEYEEIDYENEGIPIAVCSDCEYSTDTRPMVRKLLGKIVATGVNLTCRLKRGERCDHLNPTNECDEFSMKIFYG
jgi:hypothetical protein